MRIDAGLDTGDMLLKAETEIGAGRDRRGTGPRAWPRWARICWSKRWPASRRARSFPQKQDNAQATYAPLLKKEDGRIDWSQPAPAIHNRVRGLQPWPGAYTTFRGQALHIWKSRAAGRWPPTREPNPGALASAPAARSRRTAARAPWNFSKCSSKAASACSAADFANGQRLAENENLRRVAQFESAARIRLFRHLRRHPPSARRTIWRLIVTGLPATAAAVFTQNRVQAAPVQLCRRHSERCRAAASAPSW